MGDVARMAEYEDPELTSSHKHIKTATFIEQLSMKVTSELVEKIFYS